MASAINCSRPKRPIMKLSLSQRHRDVGDVCLGHPGSADLDYALVHESAGASKYVGQRTS